MYTIKLMNEFMHGVIWVYEGGIPSFYNLVDNDEILCGLNEQTEELFNSYYEFDSHNSPCWFNEELKRKTKDKMLDLVTQIKKRLNEINDGSFTIEDYATEYLQNL